MLKTSGVTSETTHTTFNCLFYTNIPRFPYHCKALLNPFWQKMKTAAKIETNLMANPRQTIRTSVNVEACGYFPFRWHFCFKITYVPQRTQWTYFKCLFCICFPRNYIYSFMYSHIDVLTYMCLFKKVRNCFNLLFRSLHVQTYSSYTQKRPVRACLSCCECGIAFSHTVYLLMFLFKLFLRTFQIPTLSSYLTDTRESNSCIYCFLIKSFFS